MATKATDEENDRYIHNLCIACGQKPHSAGRPRCDDCHKQLHQYEPGLKRRDRRRR